VQLSQWSRFAGVEVAFIGVLGYIGLLVLSLAALQPRWSGRRWPAALLVLLAGLGVVFTIYLTYLELFVIHAICWWCVSSGFIILAIFVAAMLDLRRLSPERSAR
jgi:uncharacterized membrane protein